MFDHHASPYAAAGSLFKIAEATKLAGLRSCLCYEVSERDGGAILDAGIRENADFIKYCNQINDPLLKGMFGLHASVTLSDRALEKCVRENENSGAGFHIHVAEGIQDRWDALEKYGCGVVERLFKQKILGDKTIAAHCIHISDKEIDILKETGTTVVHNPESNMGNAVGVSPVLTMFEKGRSPWDGDRRIYMRHAGVSEGRPIASTSTATGNPSAAWGREPPAMLFENNRTIAAKYFEKPLGVLEAGAAADIIVADYTPPTRAHVRQREQPSPVRCVRPGRRYDNHQRQGRHGKQEADDAGRG